MKKKIKKVFGILALAVGIIGLVFPVIPGWALIFTGLAIL